MSLLATPCSMSLEPCRFSHRSTSFIPPQLKSHSLCPRIPLHTFRRKSLTPSVLRFPSNSNGFITTAALGTVAATAATTATSLVTYIKGSIDPIILGATASASYKLFLVCVAVGWLLKTNKIPGATASVLSQVSFQLLIPCMLFSKVASTLAAAPDTTFLLGMAAAAITQIIIGAFWGTLLAPLVDAKGLKDFSIFGRQPFSPGGRSATAIASATAAATGLPQAAPALLPRPAPTPPGLRELITAACAFGNSFTLPAVFFLSLLPGVLADQAIAYSGLFLLAWSPCLWSFGLNIVENGFTRGNNVVNGTTSTNGGTSGQNNRVLQQPQQQQQLTGNIMAMSAGGGSGGGGGLGGGAASSATIDLETSPLQIPPLPLTAKVKLHAILNALSRFASRTLNPPVLAILVGAIVGLSPAGKDLFLALKSGPAAGFSTASTRLGLGYLPFELSLVWAGLKGAYEVIEMLAAGTLAIQTLVLASSLLQPAPSNTAPSSTSTDDSDVTSAAGSGMLKALWKALAPSDATEARALAVLALVRFLLVPTTAILVWKWVSRFGFVGSFASDPLFLFVLAVQCVMPSAQNLIIVLQLSDATRPAAPAFAKLLLKLYAYAVLPVTLWVTAFASRLHIPLV